MITRLVRLAAPTALVLAMTTQFASAAVKPHALFSDNAVLQQGEKLKVWGTADGTDKVTVAIEGQEVSAEVKDKKWQAELTPIKAGGPYTMTISQGADRVELKNLLAGEVWLCGGQSNMEWGLQSTAGGAEAIAESGNDKIRLFTVPRTGAPEPRTELGGGKWEICSPDQVRGFSAVGYYFGRTLQKELATPIGLISSNMGGTTAERWMSPKAIEANPELKGMSTPQGIHDLYNAMIHPLAGYGVRGAIWYQGESNADRAWQYRTLLQAMITDWRRNFGKEGKDFPFLIVQLAPFMQISAEPQDSSWAELRDAQLHVAETLPNTGIAVITDVGDEKDIHPQKKREVGERLALAAEGMAYDRKIEYAGPTFDKYSVDGNKAVVTFKHVGGGLIAKGDKLTGFTIAGEDHKFKNADAKIEGDTVVVTAAGVDKPTAVRFGWSNYPVVNLWNKDNLPATPFRTDNFPVTTQDKR